MTSTAAWDRLWKEARFPPIIHWYTEEFLDYLIKWSSVREHNLFLEPGAGSGRFSYCLSERGCEVVALDLSCYSISILRRLKNMSKSLMHVVRADISRMPFKDFAFDVVYNEGVIEHFREPHLVLGEMARVTTKNGTLIFAVPNIISFHTFARQVLARFLPKLWQNRLWPYGFEKSFSRSHLKGMLRSIGFTNIEVHGLGLLYGFAKYTPRQVHVLLYALYKKLRRTTLGKLLTDYFGFQIIAKGKRSDLRLMTTN